MDTFSNDFGPLSIEKKGGVSLFNDIEKSRQIVGQEEVYHWTMIYVLYHCPMVYLLSHNNFTNFFDKISKAKQ